MDRRKFVKIGLKAGAFSIAGCKTISPPSSELANFDQAKQIYQPVTIIGSGFGGAVAAERLTKAGHSVVMLERGRRWDSPDEQPNPFSSLFPPDGRSTWLRNFTILPAGPGIPIRKYVGVLDRVDFPDIKVYRGAGYGGGSLVYSAVMVEPLEETFKKSFGTYVDVEKFYEYYYPMARKGTGTSPMPEDIRGYEAFQAMNVFKNETLNAKLQLSEHGGAIDWQQLRRELKGEIPRSLADGFTNYGTANGSKLSLDYTYLKRAELTGKLEVKTQHIVKAISQDSSSRYTVDVERISERGRVEERIRFHTDYLIVGAGSLGSTELLLRAKQTGSLPRLSDKIGKSWGNNGFVIFGRSEVSEPTGKTQGAPGIYGINADFENLPEIFVEFAQTPSFSDGKSLLYAALSDIDERGEISYDKKTDSIYISFPQKGKDQAVAACQAVLDKLIAANGGKLTNNLISQGFNDGVSYHPIGGCNMGEVCDSYGRVEGYDKLYVTDTSLFPGTSACANPALTAAAVAEWCMDEILKDFKIS